MSLLSRRDFLASLPLMSAALARAASAEDAAGAHAVPRNQNVKWALSLALWRYFPPCPFTDILDVMKETGFLGIRFTGFPLFLHQYGLSQAQLLREMSKRGLYGVSISWNGALHDPSERERDLANARAAMKFLAEFGANHLVVFSPNRNKPGAGTAAGFAELCARCDQIGELAGEMGFTAGLHNHMGQMVQTREEIDRFLSATDPRLFGFSPDTAHLNLAGCDVVATLERHRERIHFLDYKDSRWTVPAADVIQPGGKTLPKASEEARFFSSIYDLGDGQVDFPGCHRVLRSVNYRGWICVDLDTARKGPLESYRRCGAYIASRLEPIYA